MIIRENLSMGTWRNNDKNLAKGHRKDIVLLTDLEREIQLPDGVILITYIHCIMIINSL